MDNSLKFVWAYMIENGRITSGIWNYYGSSYDYATTLTYRTHESAMNILREKVKSVGVDWEKTISPESNEEFGFTDTYHPSSVVPTLLGTVYLKNGESYTIGVANAEKRFNEYIKHLRQLLEDQKRVNDILGE